ncbi:hypothetical protein ABK040_012761 [Willaertia magna]
MSVLSIDENIFYFIIFEYLDDRSLADLSLTCKSFFKLIEGNEEYNIWKLKFNNYLNLFLQNKVIPLVRENGDDQILSLKEEDKLIVINDRISKFLNNYKNKMFQNLKQLNTDKIKYMLLKYKCIFKKPSKESINSTYIYPYYNNYHTLTSIDQNFWRTFYSNLIFKPKNIYYCCILLSYFNQEAEHYSNAWQILIGVEPFYDAPFIETWMSSGGEDYNGEGDLELGFGYCVKSDAVVENGNTSYQVKTVNDGGDCIGIKIDWMDEEEISLTFYLKDKTERTFRKKAKSDREYQLVVSLVKSKQLITLFPWDGNVENLKY